MREHWRKRIKRALREPLTKLGFTNKSALFIKAILLVITAMLIRIFVEETQMPAAIEGILIGVGALISVYVLLFLFYLIKPPTPKRDGSKVLLAYREQRIVTGEGVGLPPAQDNMRWVQVYTYIEPRFHVKIEKLVLILKGKCIKAEEWQVVELAAGSSHQRYYYFQIPTSVDLTRHKAELMAFTNEEDYGSGEFTIEQLHEHID